MKYKIGNRVVLKRGLNWTQEVSVAIDRLPSGIATIKHIYTVSGCDYCYMKEIGWNWKNSEIEGLVSELAIEITRFELMDFE